MDQRSAAIGVAVVLAALAGAFVIVRTAKGPVVFGMQSGDPINAGEPPPRLLGSSNELLAPSRCIELAPAVNLSEVAPGPLDFGDAIVDASGFVAIGVVRAKGKERAAAVLTFAIAEAGAKAALIDLGASVGDDPPPHPFVVERSLIVARSETSRDRRRLSIASLGTFALGNGTFTASAPSEIASFEQTRDESLAFDAAGEGATGLVVWDDDEKGRGVIRAARAARTASASGDGARPSTGANVISPITTDAEAARIASDGAGGAWVAWIARKAELDAGPPGELASHFVESPAEAREARWVEVARIDGVGALRGAPLRLALGRVSDFDLHRTRAPDGVDVVMRDEQGVSEARGARIVRQHVILKDHDVLVGEAPVVVVAEGVGAADPIVVDDGASGLIAFVDLAERARFIPLLVAAPVATSVPATIGAPGVLAGDASIDATRRPSAEVAIDGGRVLASRSLTGFAAAGRLAGRIGRGSDRGSIVIAAGSKQDRAEARILLCER